MQIDDADAVTVPLKTCAPQGCVGVLPVDAALAEALAAGQSLKVQFSLANGKKDVGFTSSLKGLSDAFAAAAWF
jgi:invasion protein IalB